MRKRVSRKAGYIHSKFKTLFFLSCIRSLRDSQEEALPVVQPPSSRRETVWWLLQPRDHACGSTDPRKKSWGECRTAQPPSPNPDPWQPFCDCGTAFWAHWCLEWGSRAQCAAVRRCGNREEYSGPKAGAGLVCWDHPDPLQAFDSFLLWGPWPTVKVRYLCLNTLTHQADGRLSDIYSTFGVAPFFSVFFLPIQHVELAAACQ